MNDNINTASMLRVGAILDGKYRIERYLSSGGFGNTYVAINEFGEQVAVKEFFLRGINQREANNTTVSVSNTENRAQFDQQRAKFKKEAMRLRGLLSPHIVKVQAFFEQNGTSYYVMDYIDGESLAERLRRTGQPLTEAEVLDILNQVLEALDEVHNSQPPLYHLDLKPGNIMLDQQGQVLLIDFGSSKQSDGHGGVTVTAATFTREYAPLELIEGRLDKIGPWTDFYALGATLYRLLTNQTPPLYSDIQDEGTTAFHWPATVTQPMRDLTQWMMTPNRNLRPQSVADIRHRLASFPSVGATEPSYPPKLGGSGVDMAQGLVEEPSSPPKLGTVGGGMSATDETNVASQPASVDPATRIQTRHPINADKLQEWASDPNQSSKRFAVKRFGATLFTPTELQKILLYESDEIRHSTSNRWQNLGLLINNYTRIAPAVSQPDSSAASPGSNPANSTTGSNSTGGNYSTGTNGTGNSYGTGGYNSGGYSTGGYYGTGGSSNDGESNNSFVGWLIGIILAGILITLVATRGCESTAEQVDTSYASEPDTAAAFSPDSAEIYNAIENRTFTGHAGCAWEDGWYYGNFKNGLPEGEGKFVAEKTGYQYDGNWHNGKKEGKGIELFNNVTSKDAMVQYEGDFKNGMRNGIGTVYYNDKTYQKGSWKNNELLSVTEEGTWEYNN